MTNLSESTKGNNANTVLATGMYKNVCDEKPEHGKCYIVCNSTGQNYHIAFWDDDMMDFINQTGKLTIEFVMYTPLPIYTCS